MEFLEWQFVDYLCGYDAGREHAEEQPNSQLARADHPFGLGAFDGYWDTINAG